MIRTSATLRSGALAAALALAPLPGLAALSGFYDSAAQIQVILDSAELADALSQLPIDEIEFDEIRRDGLIEWNVGSQRCDVDVFLRAIPPEGPGATRYEIERISRCD
ncbi:hypothetical protein [Pseudogemmobacter sonorensis]|uniref:hypothetical protein n=1 Tax=Pseudogemmobacter sonorensis TaxID=2989681 RepID=UPI0036CE83DE